MLNQLIFVGKNLNKIEVIKNEKGEKYAVITLEIPRSFKNADGEYETDYISAIAYDNIAANTAEYLLPGDIVGIKGRIQSKVVEKEGKKTNELDIICEKITFLSSKHKDEEETDE